MEISNKQKINWISSALIIVDMQNFFYGEEPQIPIDKTTDIITPIKKLIHNFRTNGSIVIWTKSHHETIMESIYQFLNPYHINEDKPFFLRDSRHFEIIPELINDKNSNDIIIEKERYSAFYKTKLNEILVEKGISDLYICGVTTNICVESTIRDSFERNYKPFLFSDATASINSEMKTMSLELIKAVFGFVIHSNDLN